MGFTQVLSDAKAREKPCLRCQTSLRANLDAIHCPTCGLSVWLSLNQNDALDGSSAAWLRRLSIGAAGMAAGQLIALLAWIALIVDVGPAPKRYAAGCALAGIYFIVYHAAMLLLTTHEGRYPDRLKTFRKGLLIASAAGIFVGAILLATGITRLPGGWPMPRAAAPPAALEDPDGTAELVLPFNGWLILGEVMLAGSVLATWLFLRKLAQRVPNSTISRICGWLLLAPVLAFMKIFPCFGAFLVYQFAWVFLYAPLFYFPGTAVLLAWFARAFYRSAGHGAEHSGA